MYKTFNMKLIAQILLITVLSIFSAKAQSWEYANKIEFQGNNVFLDNQLAKAVDQNGNIYIAAKITSMMSWYRISFGNNNFLNKKSDHDIFIAKYNSNGTFAWAKSYGDSNLLSISNIIDITIDPQGNPVIIGTFNADLTFDNFTVYTGGNAESTFIVKLNASTGACTWASQFQASSVNPGSYVNPTAIDIDNNGIIYIAGHFGGLCNFGTSVNPAMLEANSGEMDLYIVRLNSAGTIQWYEQFKSSGTKIIMDLKCDNSGNIIVGGKYKNAGPVFGINSFPSSTNEELFLLKLNQNKGLEWMKYSTGTSTQKIISSIDIDNNGNVYALGTFLSTGNINLDNLNLSPFGGVNNNTDILLLKYNSSGSLEWLKKAGGTASDQTYNIDVANDGLLYVSAFLRTGQLFSPISITSNLGVGVVKYGNDGNALSYKSGDAGLVTYGQFEILPSGNGFLTGYFRNTAQFGNTTLTISNGYYTTGIYVAKYFESLVIPSEINQFYPTSGYTNTSVVIYGKNFNNATSVSFNNILSSNFTKVNDTIIIAKVPNVASTGKIKIEFTGGLVEFSQNDFVVKSNNNSISDWSMAIQNSTTSSDEYIEESTSDLNGNIIYVGNYKNSITLSNITLNSNGAEDMFVAKWNQNGNLIWAKSFGGGLIDKVNGVCTDINGNIYITGYYTSQITFGNIQLLSGTDADIFIVKLNSIGEVVWAKKAGGLDGDDKGLDISCDIFGNISLTGSIIGTVNFDNIVLNMSSLGSLKLFVAKYNNSGNALWAKEAKGGGNVYSNSVAVDYNNNTYIMGIVPGTLQIGGITLSSEPAWWIDYFIAKYDHQGTMVWAKKINGHPSYNGSIVTDADGNIYYSGTEKIINNVEIAIAKYNTDGIEQWKLVGQGPDLDFSNDISISASGDIAVCGQFNTTLNLGNQNLAGHALFGNEMFVAKIDNNGNPISLHQATNLNTSSENASTISFNSENEIYVGGKFSGSASFGNITLVANTGTDLFIAKLSNTSTGLNKEITKALKIYPNPITDSESIIIDGCKNENDISYTIYNNIGRIIQYGTISEINCSINISALVPGVYFIKTDKGNATFVKNN